MQTGRVQTYLRLLALAVVVLAAILIWSSLECDMSGIPLLTLLTVLPLVGAAIALFSGRHARSVAIVTASGWASAGTGCVDTIAG